LDMEADQYLLNSITIALLVSLIGVSLSFFTAYLTARMKSKMSKFLHLIAITSAAVPGIVLGLSYVIVFNQSFIYGTIAILVMVNLIHFFASPYLMMYNSLNKINENLESVGQMLGISRLRMIKDIFIPQSMTTIFEMSSYFFVNCMMTISAVSFLATMSNKPVALMINQFEAQMQLECAAIVSLAILTVNLLIKALVYFAKKAFLYNRSNI
jgi:iron(III) transport system permease protein